jgi:hypothetical protein
MAGSGVPPGDAWEEEGSRRFWPWREQIVSVRPVELGDRKRYGSCLACVMYTCVYYLQVSQNSVVCCMSGV